MSTLPARVPRDASGIWLLAARLSTSRGDVFLYGAAAPCARPAGWRETRSVKVSDGEIEVIELLLTEDRFRAVEARLVDGAVDHTDWFGSEYPPTPIAAVRRVIQSALGETAAETSIHYTLPPLSAISNDEAGLAAVLTALEEATGQPFMTSHAPRLGAFEVFTLDPAKPPAPPILFEIAQSAAPDSEAPQTWEISRITGLAQTPQIAHFVGLSAGDTVVDRLVRLEAGVRRTPILAPEPLDAFELSVFDAETLTLVHREKHTLIRQIHLNLSPILRRTSVQDALSRKAAQGGPALVQRSTEVQGRTSQRSVVGAPPNGSWRRRHDELQRLAAHHSSARSEDRWFPRGVTGEVEVIERINALASSTHASAAVLVDPWFGIDALSRLIPRLDSLDLAFTVVTSWSVSDPDTERPFEDVEHAVARLRAGLETLGPLIHPKVKVINLVDGGDQAFHDRYLLLHPHDEPANVFLLSNSLNSAVSRWPFVMSRLANDVADQVRDYIEGLLADEDRARGKPLTRNFAWPPDAP